MSKIITVFAKADTNLGHLEETAKLYDLAVGPFGASNEAELVDFLTKKLSGLKAICHQNNHQLFLHLKPENSAWLLECLNRLSNLGLNPFCVDGLILDTSSYPGSLYQLWSEAYSFSGKKFLTHTKRSAEYCKNLFAEMLNNKWDGLYARVEGEDEEDRYNQTIVLLQIGRNSYRVNFPIWTELFSSGRMNDGSISAKSDGFHIKFEELRFEQ